MILLDLSAYYASVRAIAYIYFITVVSPGPDMAITMKNSILHSRKAGIYSALGTVTGMSLHFIYTITGISYLITNVPWLFRAIQLTGALYLVYIGYSLFKTAKPEVDKALDTTEHTSHISNWQAFKSGLLTNALNPMVILLFIGILSSYVTNNTATYAKIMYGGTIVAIASSWFLFVAIFFSNPKIRKIFHKAGKWLNRVTGVILIAFGIKVAIIAAKIF